MKRTTMVFAIAFGLLCLVIPACNHSSEEAKSKQTQEKKLYQCPMDCESGKTYDKPGHCPVCEMDLEQKIEI